MLSYNVHEAKSNLSQLLKRVEQGEEIVIMRNGEPLAKLVRCRRAKRQKTQLGWAAGQVKETPGWEKAMSREEAERFLGFR